MARRPSFDTVDQYLVIQSDAARRALREIRSILHEELPGATEGISYGIPVLKVGGAYALYFAGYAEHVAIYPVTPAILALGGEVARHLSGKATLRFPLAEPLPSDLIRRIARARATELAR
jgi:uncharacterized protein YdhG (YjbR/CyaY superfamily)